MIKVFFVKKPDVFLHSEEAKRVGFTFESANTLGIDGEGYYFWFNAGEEFFKTPLFKDVEEVKGKEKEKVLSAFEKLEEEKMAGIGGLF